MVVVVVVVVVVVAELELQQLLELLQLAGVAPCGTTTTNDSSPAASRWRGVKRRLL